MHCFCYEQQEPPLCNGVYQQLHVVSGCRKSNDLVLRKKKHSLHHLILALAAFLTFHDSLLFLCSRW